MSNAVLEQFIAESRDFLQRIAEPYQLRSPPPSTHSTWPVM